MSGQSRQPSMERPTVAERLDIEDDEDRQRRLQSVFERMNTKPCSSTNPTPSPGGLPKFDFGDRSTFEIKPNSELLSRLQSFLPRLQASNESLLRQAKLDPTSVDIEHITEGTETVIQMDLGLGLFKDKKQTTEPSGNNEDTDMSDSCSSSSVCSSSASSSSASSSSSTSSSSDSTSGKDTAKQGIYLGRSPTRAPTQQEHPGEMEDWDSDSSSEIITGFVPTRPIRPIPRRRGKGSGSTLGMSAPSTTDRPSIVVLGEQLALDQ